MYIFNENDKNRSRRHLCKTTNENEIQCCKSWAGSQSCAKVIKAQYRIQTVGFMRRTDLYGSFEQMRKMNA
jgi:hypothetical protein